MFERFTQDARDVVVRAQEEARRLGHPAIGTSHLLLALVAADDPTARLLAAHGVDRDAATDALRRVLRGGEPPAPAGGPAPDEDAAALSALGFDLDRIRAAVEAAFGPGALERPAPPPARRGLPRLRPRSRRSRPEIEVLRLDDRPGAGHIPFSPDARKALELTLREALRLGDRELGTEHLLLGLLRGGDTVAVGMLVALDVPPAGLRRALEEGRRRSA